MAFVKIHIAPSDIHRPRDAVALCVHADRTANLALMERRDAPSPDGAGFAGSSVIVCGAGRFSTRGPAQGPVDPDALAALAARISAAAARISAGLRAGALTEDARAACAEARDALSWARVTHTGYRVFDSVDDWADESCHEFFGGMSNLELLTWTKDAERRMRREGVIILDDAHRLYDYAADRRSVEQINAGALRLRRPVRVTP